MNKLTLTVLFLCVCACGARAQKLTYGFKLSAGFAHQHNENVDLLSTGSVKTVNLRGIVQMPVSKHYWLEAGLGYLGKGSVVSIDALTTTTRLNYADLTLSALRKFALNNKGAFYLGVGPYLAMGLNGKFEYETPGSNTSDKLLFGKNNDIRRFDAGLNFNTGLEFRNRVTFNIGYTLGLNNIASDPQKDSGTPVVKNREFLIGLGYRFK